MMLSDIVAKTGFRSIFQWNKCYEKIIKEEAL